MLRKYALLSSSCLQVRISLSLSFLALPFLVLSFLVLYHLPSPFSITLYASSASYARILINSHLLPTSSAIDLHYPKRIRYLEANIKVLVPLQTKKQIKIKGTMKGR